MKIQDRAVHQIASYSNQILETAQISTNSRTVATEFYPVRVSQGGLGAYFLKVMA